MSASYFHHISQDGVTALMVASANGHPSVVRTLLKAGAAVNATSQVGYTLNSAIMLGSMILSVMTLAYSEPIQVPPPTSGFVRALRLDCTAFSVQYAV